MAKRLMVWLSLAIGAGTIFWLGYSVGRVQNIGELAMRSRDADTDRFSLSRGGVVVHFERMGGDGKPYVRSSAGAELLDLSDWDRDSRIIVDGTLFELVRLYPQSSVDYERWRIAETLNGDGWLIEREMSLAEDGTLHVVHSFIARRPIRHVDVALAHTHQYFLALNLSEVGAEATVNALTRDQIASGVTAPASHRVRVRASSVGSAPVRFRYGAASQYGPSGFVIDMSADEPPLDTRVTLGEETVTVESLPS